MRASGASTESGAAKSSFSQAWLAFSYSAALADLARLTCVQAISKSASTKLSEL